MSCTEEPEGGRNGGDAGQRAPASTGVRAPDAGGPATSRSAENGSGAPSKDLLTIEYLRGGWCFAPQDGMGERGIYLFDADGSYQVGLGWTWNDTHHRFEAWTGTLSPEGDVEDFRQRFTELLEIEQDRFVILWPNREAIVFERGPCGEGRET